MSDSYYVRVRGEVKGPVARSELVSQIRKKRIGRHHEVSTDAVNWMRAGDVPDLFEPVVAVRQAVEPQPEQSSSAANRRGGTQRSDDDSTTGGESKSLKEWFYAKGRNRLGPIPESELRAMLATGRVTGEDLVWNDSLEDWIAAGSLPQFAGISSVPSGEGAGRTGDAPFQKQATFVQVLLGLSQGADLPEKAAWKFPNLTRYLSITEGIVRVMFVIALVLTCAGWIYDVVEAIKQENAFRLVVGICLGPLAVLFYWLMFISFFAVLEVIKVLLRIEDNTSKS